MNNVSIIIPLHNYANWVGAAIQSAKDQTHKAREIIVIDDASTDNPVIPKGVIYIKNDINIGVAETRNKGITRAKGDIILCLDADDILCLDYIARGLPKFQEPRVGIVYGSLSLMDEKQRETGKRWFDSPFSWKDQEKGMNRIPTCCMFRKEAWLRAGGYRKYESPAEDAGLWTRIAAQGWQVKFINDNRPTLYYRMHDGSESRTHKFPDWVNNRAWKQRNSGIGNPVQIYDCPQVGFILAYSPQNELAFIQTIDSIEGLKAIDWEICASGIPTPRLLAGWPFVRWNVESGCNTHVFLEAGEIVTEQDWSTIQERKEWPR